MCRDDVFAELSDPIKTSHDADVVANLKRSIARQNVATAGSLCEAFRFCGFWPTVLLV